MYAREVDIYGMPIKSKVFLIHKTYKDRANVTAAATTL